MGASWPMQLVKYWRQNMPRRYPIAIFSSEWPVLASEWVDFHREASADAKALADERLLLS